MISERMMLQEKLDYLIEKYIPGLSAEISDDGERVIIGKESFNLFSHRFERRFIELKNLVNDGTLSDLSVIRINRMEPSGSSVEAIVMRELDVCRFLTGKEFISIAVFNNAGKAANIIAKLDNGVVCTLEISATLPCGAEPIDKHEITSRRGVACDRVVDTQIPQSSVYVFGENFEAYQDVDFELYGLNIYDCAKVRAAFALTRDEFLRRSFKENEYAIRRLLNAYRESLMTGDKVVICNG
jgi:hypothetical protein